MQLKSEEVNYLIYRYLLEAGFAHSAFTFSHEGLLNSFSSNIKPEQVPPGALITLLHKGQQYTEIELHTNEDGTIRKCNKPVLLIEKHICDYVVSTDQEDKSIYRQQQQSLTQKKQQLQQDINNKQKKRQEQQQASPTQLIPASVSVMEHPHPHPQPKTGDGGNAIKISDETILTLQGHTAEVYTCSWNPNGTLLATGAGDSSARIWTLGSNNTFNENSIILSSEIATATADAGQKKAFIITTLEWDPVGSRLAAGSSEGTSYVWNADGTLCYSTKNHSASIFSIRWNPEGEYLLTGGEDSLVVVQRTSDGSTFRSLQPHVGSVLDVDWKDSQIFASCSQDMTIKIFSTASPNEDSLFDPLLGHEKEINAIKWNPSGTLLASCSDDKTAKIWSIDPTPSMLHNLTGHTDGIYTVEWNPNPISKQLATASFDGTARIWDTLTGTCLFTLARHTKPVYSISFTPDGRQLATGSVDKNVFMWDTDSGALLYQYGCKGGVYDLCWSPNSNFIAVCTTRSQVFVIDLGLREMQIG